MIRTPAGRRLLALLVELEHVARALAYGDHDETHPDLHRILSELDRERDRDAARLARDRTARDAQEAAKELDRVGQA